MTADLVWPRKMQNICDLLDEARSKLQHLTGIEASTVTGEELYQIRDLTEEATMILSHTALRQLTRKSSKWN